MKNVITKTLVASAISTAMLAGAAQAAVTMVLGVVAIQLLNKRLISILTQVVKLT